MARPVTRATRLAPDICNAILGVFGTQFVAYKQLSRAHDLVTNGVTPSTFARALRGELISVEQSAAITLAWDLRRVLPVAA